MLQLLNPEHLEPPSCNYWAFVLQLLNPEHLEPILCSKRHHHMSNLGTTMKSSLHSLQLEKALEQQRRPSAFKNKYIKNLKKDAMKEAWVLSGHLGGRVHQVSSALDRVICLWDTCMEISSGQLDIQGWRKIKFHPCLGGSCYGVKETEMWIY